MHYDNNEYWAVTYKGDTTIFMDKGTAETCVEWTDGEAVLREATEEEKQAELDSVLAESKSKLIYSGSDPGGYSFRLYDESQVLGYLLVCYLPNTEHWFQFPADTENVIELAQQTLRDTGYPL